MKKIVPLIIVILVSITSYSQTMNWRSLPKEVNGYVYSLAVYDGKLIAGGGFNHAGSMPIKALAAWDGENWTSLGTGISGWSELVNELMVYNNDLYVAGNFQFAGSIPAANIAKWNGTSWTSFGIQGRGQITAIAFFNNELYVGGTFDSIGGIAANHIARWNGTNWNALGPGVNGERIFDLYPFNNELYALGDFDSAGTIASNYIAKWDGLKWDSVSNGLTLPAYNMTAYNNKLLIGSLFSDTSTYTNILQWDGQALSLFCHQKMIPLRTLTIIDNQLYATGAGVSRWDTLTTTWQEMGTGLTNTLFINKTHTICEYNGALFCGGGFIKAEEYSHNYIARYTDITAIQDHSETNYNVSIFPLPATSAFSIDVQSSSIKYPLQFSVYDLLGKLVYTSLLSAANTTINDFEYKGVFVWKIEDAEQHQQTGKLITQ